MFIPLTPELSINKDLPLDTTFASDSTFNLLTLLVIVAAPVLLVTLPLIIKPSAPVSFVIFIVPLLVTSPSKSIPVPSSWLRIVIVPLFLITPVEAIFPAAFVIVRLPLELATSPLIITPSRPVLSIVISPALYVLNIPPLSTFVPTFEVITMLPCDDENWLPVFMLSVFTKASNKASALDLIAS